MSDSALPGVECVTYQPLPDGGYQTAVHNPGITLLDYFAGQALAGMLAEASMAEVRAAEAAGYAYDFGQAMLDEKAKREHATNV